MPKEIELGNGYGYFCNIHDMESQKPIVNNHIHMNYYRRYLEEIERHEGPSNDMNDNTLCACSLFSFMVIVCCFIL
jgi:hypothetical protein